jgi:hypothetical protein
LIERDVTKLSVVLFKKNPRSSSSCDLFPSTPQLPELSRCNKQQLLSTCRLWRRCPLR